MKVNTENVMESELSNRLSPGPKIQDADLKALLRFNETCDDGEGYDIGKDAMSRLVELGLASKGPHSIRYITAFGRWVIEREEGDITEPTLKTEDDLANESAVRLCQLRTGAGKGA